MKREVIWIWAAEMDDQEVFVLLDAQSPGAGIRMVELTDQLLALLQDCPCNAPVWRPPLRRVVLRKTPYALYYVVEPNRLVITGMQDVRRNPDRLRRDLLRHLPKWMKGGASPFTNRP